MLLRIVLALGAISSSLVIISGAEESATGWTKERIREVRNRAKTDPDALWEFQHAPLELIYEPLTEIWMNNAASFADRMEMRAKGREEIWLETQRRVGRDPDYDDRIFPVARDVLVAHPDFESYLRGKLEFITKALLDHRIFPRTNDPRYRKLNDSDLYPYLDVAYRVPGDMAFRVIGPCLFGAHYPVEDHGDYKLYSPATNARSRLAALAKERLGEMVPEDIEAARQWWKNNEHRFAVKPSAPPDAPAAVSPTIPAPPATPTPSLATPSAPPTPPTGSASQPSSRRWSYLAIALVVLSFGAVFWQRRVH